MTVATRARWRVESADKSDGATWEEAEGARKAESNEGAEEDEEVDGPAEVKAGAMAGAVERGPPCWIRGMTLVNAASSRVTLRVQNVAYKVSFVSLTNRSKRGCYKTNLSNSSAFSRSKRSVLSFPFAALDVLSRKAAFSASSWTTRD